MFNYFWVIGQKKVIPIGVGLNELLFKVHEHQLAIYIDRLPFDGPIHTKTIGFSGGSWLLWNSDRVEVTRLASIEQEIHVLVKVRPLNISWLFSTVYASPRIAERLILWNNLISISVSNNLPWVVASDFNEPLLDSDKFGGKAISVNNSLLFKDYLDKCNRWTQASQGQASLRQTKET